MSDLRAAQLAAASGMFSSRIMSEMARMGKSSLLIKLARQSLHSHILANSDSVAALFEAAFAVLKREGWRDEYIYKSALTRNVLLGTHSLNTASMLTEFRIAECKADVVILNGTATVYEVKSERDSLSRLQRQVAAYRTVFARVFVVTAATHLDCVLGSVPSEVGVMLLCPRGHISTVREAADCPEGTSSAAIFESLRTDEARIILQSLGIGIPAVPNTRLRRALADIFVELQPRAAHDGMVKVLKQTRNLRPLSDLVQSLPRSLHAAALTVRLRKSDHARLISAVNTPLIEAMSWA
jgi:hypothetical protein